MVVGFGRIRVVVVGCAIVVIGVESGDVPALLASSRGWLLKVLPATGESD